MTWGGESQQISLRKLLIRNMQISKGPGMCADRNMLYATATLKKPNGGRTMISDVIRGLWQQDEGQDIAEYAVMLAVILVIVVGTIRLIGGNANNVFSAVASSISQ